MGSFTPEQQAAYSRGEIDRFGNPIGGAQRTVDPASIIALNAQNAAGKNTEVVNSLNTGLQQVQGGREYADAYDRFALQEQQGLAGGTSAALAGQTQLGYNNAAGANQAGQSLVNQLGGYYGGISAQNQAGYNQYEQAIAPYRAPVADVSYKPISGDAYGTGLQNNALSNFNGMMNGSMDISAAQVGSVAQAQAALAQAQMYYSDPTDVTRQINSYQALQGAGSGDLDYTATNYLSDRGDILAQKDAKYKLDKVGEGALDWQSQAGDAYADPATVNGGWQIYNNLVGMGAGSLDQTSQAAQAHASQDTINSQKQGLDKLWGLTDPNITAQERLIMEEARRNQEQSNRASRGAVMSDLQSRGFGGAGAQMTDMQGAQEQTGQERTLADLGAEANAVARSQNALGMYVDATGQLRSQEFDEAFARAAAGDQMAVANANRRLQATGMAADQINFMQQASFDQAYKRGLANDQASAANQATRLSGIGMAADQANNIRAANDAVGMFNTNQTNTAQANNQSTRLSGMGMAAQQSNAIRSANDEVGQGNANRQTSVNMQNSVNQTQTNQFNAGETNRVNMFNTGEQNRVGIANQDIRARGAEDYGTQANAIRTANDVIAMHNSQQQVIVDQGNQKSRIEDDRRLTDLAAQEQGIGQSIRRDDATMAGDLTRTGITENNLASGRNQTAIDAGTRNALATYGIGMDLVGGYSAYGQNTYNRALGTAQLGNEIGKTSIQANLNNAQLQDEGPKLQMSEEAYRQAQGALAAQPSGGLLSGLLKPLGLG